MLDRQELTLGISFIIANTAVAALTGDWMFFEGEPNLVVVSNDVSCMVYNHEAYNLFGTICGVDLSDIESFITTLQITLSVNLSFSLLLFFLIAFNRMRKKMIVFTTLIIMGLTVSTLLLWELSEKTKLPSKGVNYRGAGWYLTLMCSIACLPMFYAQLRS